LAFSLREFPSQDASSVPHQHFNFDKPLDITEKQINYWLMEARQAESSFLRRMLPALIPLVIIVIVSLIGLLIFGPTEGFSGSVAIGTAVAMIISPILQEIRRKAG